VAALFRAAYQAGQVSEGFGLLHSAARLRPVSGRAGLELEPVRLSTGEGPVLVCLSSYVALGGVHEYARFAGPLRGARTAYALKNPGFELDEPLPTRWTR